MIVRKNVTRTKNNDLQEGGEGGERERERGGEKKGEREGGHMHLTK